MNNQREFLNHCAYAMRREILTMTTNAGSGHPTSALSAADLVAALFFHTMRFDPADPFNPNNDRFILSKGHASPVLYAVWKELGILTEQDLMSYRKFNSPLEGHPTPRFSRSEAATGSLGQGLSVGIGMALAARLDRYDYKTYVLMGDSECAEGSVWEAAELAAYYKLNNLIGIIDCNRLGQTTETLEGHHAVDFAEKFTAFGWYSLVIDGHDMKEIIEAFDQAQKITNQPVMIIAKTIKGYGVEKAEDKNGFHGKVFKRDELPQILEELKTKFTSAVQKPHYQWKPQYPSEFQKKLKESDHVTIGNPSYTLGDMVATRKAYGQAVKVVGEHSNQVVCLDAEVKNSTYAEIFEEAFPERFFQCFVAEQNMVGMAVGLNARGKIPFASTFGSFFTRAYDQIRMAAIGRTSVRLVGSHCGVSIGQDGPSQMALEDIAMMRAIPDSVILYPCDAVSCWKLVECMANHHMSISYLRTTRSETPVIYNQDHQFTIGGCSILKQSDHDVVCVIAAGITVFEALKAYKHLAKDSITFALIDLYCIKPLDASTLLKVARASNNRIITLEDHYIQGGLGEAVVAALKNTGVEIHCMAVTKLPRSGTPDELLAYEEINAQALEGKIKQLI